MESFRIDGHEADDLIATYVRLAKEAGRSVTIFSPDKDFFQLVGSDVNTYDGRKFLGIGPLPAGPEEVRKKIGLEPWQMTHYLALTGDTADNVKGVTGVRPGTNAKIGPAGARQLLAEFGTVTNLLRSLDDDRVPSRLKKRLQGTTVRSGCNP